MPDTTVLMKANRSIIPVLLTALLVVMPMGLTGASSCDLGGVFDVEVHHHGHDLPSPRPCTDDAEHDREDSVPCGETCSIDLPTACPAPAAPRAPAVLPAFVPNRDGFRPAAAAATASAARNRAPPDDRPHLRNEAMTGCLLL